MLGLREDWPALLRALREVSTYYRRLSSAISLGLDRRLRAEVVKGFFDDGDVVLDAGAGDGSLTEHILGAQPRVGLLVMLDPLKEMLRLADALEAEKVVGVFESLPFRSSSFNAVTLAFSLRDSYDMEKAVRELARTLKPEGRLCLLDIGKPDKTLPRAFFTLYWRILAPLLAAARLGVKGLKAAEIYPTYRRLPRNADLEGLMKKFFSAVERREKLLGGVLMLRAKDPTPSP